MADHLRSLNLVAEAVCSNEHYECSGGTARVAVQDDMLLMCSHFAAGGTMVNISAAGQQWAGQAACTTLVKLGSRCDTVDNCRVNGFRINALLSWVQGLLPAVCWCMLLVKYLPC